MGLILPGPVPPPDRWAGQAACRNAGDPEIFFRSDPAGRYDPGEDQAALAYCVGCLVRETCLAWAMQNREKFGVWGGTTARERRRLFKQGGGEWRRV